MPEEIIKVIIPAIIALLILLLIYRIKAQIKNMIKNEVYNNFPMIKNKIEDFSIRIDFLKTQLNELEQKINRHKEVK